MLPSSQTRKLPRNRRRPPEAPTPSRTRLARGTQEVGQKSPFSTTIRESPPVPNKSESVPQPAAADEVESYRAAGFWRRLAAGLIDLAVILPISLALAWSVGAITGLSLPAASQSALDYWIDLVLEGEPALVSVGLLLVCIFCAYSLVFLVTLGRTLGGIAVKTRIIDVYGGRPGVPRALARTLGCVLSACTLGLGFLWIAADPQRRSLHDWLSGTHTIRT